jgi:hypothetical protein
MPQIPGYVPGTPFGSNDGRAKSEHGEAPPYRRWAAFTDEELLTLEEALDLAEAHAPVDCPL